MYGPTRHNIATELAIEENSKKTDKTDEQLVPAEYHKYLDIFSKEKAHRFPKSRPWDHKIKMKEGFEPKSFKNYNLTPAEQIELDKFLKENLEKGYIWPSQSPITSPFSLFPKRMANFDHARTTGIQTIGWSKTPILYHLFRK
jgi:hypothetical protein